MWRTVFPAGQAVELRALDTPALMIDTSACMSLPLRSMIPLALLVLAACGAEEPLRPGVPPRHLVLVTVEGMRADHSSAYLYGRRTTSFEIDAGGLERGRALTPDHLAQAGVLFRHASAPSGQVELSLGALLAGARPLEVDYRDDVRRFTLAERFAQKGFHCAAFVSQSNGPTAPANRRGFRSFEEGENDLAALGSAVSFMAEHDWGNQQGVFLWLHLSGPIYPFEPPTFPQNYHGDQPVDYAALFADPAYAGSMQVPLPTREELRARTDLLPADVEHLEALYDGELAHTSYLIWLTLDLLRYFSETEDAMADALLCVAGVNGMQLDPARPGFASADSSDDAALGVPLLLHHPASLTGRRVLESQVTLEDLPRTFADWFDLEGREDLRGRSLLALMDREPRESFEERASCSYDIASVEVSARGPVWRLTVPLRDLGEVGAPMPSSARFEPVMGLRRLPVDPDGSAALGLLEELRAWALSQREWR
ncbi:MAG: hypothetical protein ACI8QC_003304 [Planctomycetota bacterium]|jgi:hypothetical protein